MATSGDNPNPKDQDFRHSCGLCLEAYRGRSPKLLPCFHTFCLPCLTSLLDSASTVNTPPHEGLGPPAEEPDSPAEGQGQGQSLEMEAEHDAVGNTKDSAAHVVENGKFLCPTCRALVNVPEGGVAALQANFYLDYEDVEPRSGLVLCDACDDSSRERATHQCRQCQRCLCAACKRCHDKLTRDHHVTPIQVGQSAGRTEEKDGCQFHRDQPLCYFCRQCDIGICLKCKAKSHDGHVTIDMDQAALESRQEVVSLASSAVEQLQLVKRCVGRLESDEQKLMRHVETVKQQVQDRYDAMITWVQRSRDAVLYGVTIEEKETKRQMASAKAEAAVSIETLSALVTRAAGTRANNPDVVGLRKDLQSALLGGDRLSHFGNLADPQKPVWTWCYDVTEADVLPRELVAAYMGRVGNGGATDDLRPLSLKELIDRVDTWVTETTSLKTLTASLADKSELKELTDTVGKWMTETSSLKTFTTSLADKSELKELTDTVGKWMTETSSLQTFTTSLADKRELKALTDTVEKWRTETTRLNTLTKSLAHKMGISVSFYAITTIHWTFYAEMKPHRGRVINYDNVFGNDGDHFNVTTGTFTAPVQGTYIFAATVSCKNQQEASAFIIVGKEEYHIIWDSVKPAGSGIIILTLQAGRQVQLQADGVAKSSKCTFMGCLIQPKLSD